MSVFLDATGVLENSVERNTGMIQSLQRTVQTDQKGLEQRVKNTEKGLALKVRMGEQGGEGEKGM